MAVQCTCGMADAGMAYGPMDECPQHLTAEGFARVLQRLRDAESGRDTTHLVLEVTTRCMDQALEVMNDAIRMCPNDGPLVALEYIADYLNGTDGEDEGIAADVPDDWLTRWSVDRRG